jgi:predicted RNase H-like HicB family nuclease
MTKAKATIKTPPATEVRLTGKLRKRKRWVLAVCPELDVASQGDDETDAKRMLTEAVTLFLDDLCLRGFLRQVLEESGLPVPVPGAKLKVLLDFGGVGESHFEIGP